MSKNTDVVANFNVSAAIIAIAVMASYITFEVSTGLQLPML